MFAKLWNDESGVVTIEYLIMGTVLALAFVVGLSNLASAVNVEYTELSNAILTLDQGYSYVAASGCAGSHNGATVIDVTAAVTYSETATAPGTVSSATLNISSCP